MQKFESFNRQRTADYNVYTRIKRHERRFIDLSRRQNLTSIFTLFNKFDCLMNRLRVFWLVIFRKTPICFVCRAAWLVDNIRCRRGEHPKWQEDVREVAREPRRLPSCCSEFSRGWSTLRGDSWKARFGKACVMTFSKITASKKKEKRARVLYKIYRKFILETFISNAREIKHEMRSFFAVRLRNFHGVVFLTFGKRILQYIISGTCEICVLFFLYQYL